MLASADRMHILGQHAVRSTNNAEPGLLTNSSFLYQKATQTPEDVSDVQI